MNSTAFDMTIYCPLCNRSSEDTRFIGEFCEFCVADRIKGELAGKVDMYRCRRCSNILVKGQYIPLGNYALGILIDSELHRHDCKAKVKTYSKDVAQVEFTCEVGEDKVQFEKPIGVRAVNRVCPRCYRISAGYYEALVQLRGDVAKVSKIADSLVKYIDRKNGFISKNERVDKGIDLYISDKAIVDDFFRSREIKPGRSYKLAGIKDGKNVYKNTYALHL